MKLRSFVVAGLLLVAATVVSQTVIRRYSLDTNGLTGRIGYGTALPTQTNTGNPPVDGEIYVVRSSGSDPDIQIYSDADASWRSLSYEGGSDPGSVFGTYYISSSAATTTSSGTPTKVLGTTTAGATNNMTHIASNRLRYDGDFSVVVHCLAHISATSGTGSRISEWTFAVSDSVQAETEIQRYHTNNTDRGAVAVGGLFEMGSGDYVELYVDSDSGNIDITADFANVLCEAIGVP